MGIVTIILILFSLKAFTQLEEFAFCENPMHYEISKTLEADQNFQLGKLYVLAQLKLTYNILTELDPQKQRVGEQIDKLESELSADLVAQLKQKALAHYQVLNDSQLEEEANKIIQRYSENETNQSHNQLAAPDNTTLSRVVRLLENDCQGSRCLTHGDEAIIWMAEQMPLAIDKPNEFVMLQNQLSKYLEGLTSHLDDEALNGDTESIANDISRFSIHFQQQMAGCDGLEEIQNCRDFENDPRILPENTFNFVSLIVDDVSTNVYDDEGNFTGYPNVTTAPFYQGVQAANEELITPATEPGYRRCNGVKYQPRVRNLRSYGFNPNSIANAKLTSFSNINVQRFIRQHIRNDQSGLANGSKMRRLRRFFSNVGISGPMFRCTADPVLQAPALAYRTGEKRTCCNNRLRWKKMQYGFFNFQSGLSCRGFFGVPYVVEVGVKAGLDVVLTLGGGLEPDACRTRACASGTVRVSFSGGLYAEAFAGAGSLQGTIAWSPYVSLRQCFNESGNNPEMDVIFSPRTVTANFSVQLGWAAKKDYVKILHTDNGRYNHAISLF